MSVFKVMDGTWYEDGLVTSWGVFCAPTADECWEYIAKQAEEGPIAVRGDAVTYWVEEYESADRDSKPIWVTHPYPQKSQPDMPDWFKERMRKVVLPTMEEIRAAFTKALDATFAAKAEA